MKDEKKLKKEEPNDKKKPGKNELDDSELDRIAGGGTGFNIVEGGRCPLCREICFHDEMTYIVLNGVMTKVCKHCADGRKQG